MEGDTPSGGEAADQQEDFAIGPAEGALVEALDDVGNQQAVITGGAQGYELLDFLDGLGVAVFPIQGEAKLGNIITVQYGMQLALGLLLQDAQVAKLVVSVLQQVLAGFVETGLDVVAAEFEVLAEGVNFSTLQQRFEHQTQAFFTFLVFTATVGQDAAEIGLVVIVVEANKFVGFEPNAQLAEQLTAVGEFEQCEACWRFVALVEATGFAIKGVVRV